MDADPLMVERTGHCHLNLITDGSNNSGVLFSDATRAMVSIYYMRMNDSMNFNTGGGLRVTIDARGDVGVGTSSPGYKLDVNGDISHSW